MKYLHLPKRQPRVIIVGAGIAGLSAAARLMQLGITPTVAESLRQFPEASGHGIHLASAEAQDGLRGLGIEPWEMHQPKERGGTPVVGRNVLASGLAAVVGDEHIRYGTKLKEINASGRPAVTFANGRPEVYDYAIFADGNKSRARALLHPEAELAYANCVVFSGSSPSLLPAAPGGPSEDFITHLAAPNTMTKSASWMMRAFPNSDDETVDWRVVMKVPSSARQQVVGSAAVGRFFSEQELPATTVEWIRNGGWGELSAEEAKIVANTTHVNAVSVSQMTQLLPSAHRIGSGVGFLIGDAHSVNSPLSSSSASKGILDGIEAAECIAEFASSKLSDPEVSARLGAFDLAVRQRAAAGKAFANTRAARFSFDTPGWGDVKPPASLQQAAVATVERGKQLVALAGSNARLEDGPALDPVPESASSRQSLMPAVHQAQERRYSEGIDLLAQQEPAGQPGAPGAALREYLAGVDSRKQTKNPVTALDNVDPLGPAIG